MTNDLRTLARPRAMSCRAELSTVCGFSIVTLGHDETQARNIVRAALRDYAKNRGLTDSWIDIQLNHTDFRPVPLARTVE